MGCGSAVLWDAAMEVTLLNRSVYTIPSKKRVGAIVFDGPADMQVWPGPGPESELREYYGDNLQRALDAELRQVPGRLLEVPSILRCHPGRLHCNFLAWAATREPEPGSVRSPAPSLDIIREVVRQSLEFASSRHVERIAFPALGGGPGEESKEDRLVAIVKSAQKYFDKCYAEGRSSGIEEVFVCEASGPVFRKLKARTRDVAKIGEPEPVAAPARKPARRSAAGSKSKSKAKAKSTRATGLTMSEVGENHGAAKYNMRSTYAAGDFFTHPKFGIGKVLDLPAPGQIECAFEDGRTRKLVHGR